MVFAVAIATELKIDFSYKKLLGIVAIAIVADVMPLTDINRVMLIAGLQILNKKQLVFIDALSRKNLITTITSQTIAYHIAPLLNSAGRLEDAKIASNFLIYKRFNKSRSDLR